MDTKRELYRVNYYIGGQPVSAFVCASSGSEASGFVGVTDGSAQVHVVASPVEVVGLDKAHAALPPAHIFVAPPEPPKHFSDAEVAALRKLLADAEAKLAARK